MRRESIWCIMIWNASGKLYCFNAPLIFNNWSWNGNFFQMGYQEQSFGETAAHFIIQYPWDTNCNYWIHLSAHWAINVKYSVIKLAASGTLNECFPEFLKAIHKSLFLMWNFSSILTLSHTPLCAIKCCVLCTDTCVASNA